MRWRNCRAWRCLATPLVVLLAFVAACGPLPGTASAPVPVTRVVSVHTSTPTPLPPTATVTPSPTPTQTATPSPVPPSATPTVPPVVRFMAVGDVMLARSVGDHLLTHGPAAPFAAVADALADADVLVGNLECVIAERGTPEPKAYVFRAPPVAADALAAAGFDVLSLANNHALDYGREGLADMLPRLQEHGLLAVGAGEQAAAARAPVFVEHNGLRLAFLAYVDVPVESRSGFDTRTWTADEDSPGVAWAVAEHIAADVKAARPLADLVIVLLHFGLEGRTEVTASQQNLARTTIDAGATLVLGAHPHVLQPVEAYNGGLIVYSLGNFVFDGFSPPSTYSAIFTATLTPAGIEAYDFVPVVVENGLPRPATPDEAAVILARLGTH